MNKKSLRKTKLSQKILCSILAASVLGITGSAFAATHTEKWVVNGEIIANKVTTTGYNMEDLQAGAEITDSQFLNNEFTGTDVYGGVFRVMNTKNPDQIVTVNNTVFNGNISSVNKNNTWALGGAIMIKGATTTFTDVDFDNNKIIGEGDAVQVGGGAVYVDAVRNKDVVKPEGNANVTFKVTKDMAYTGNTIQAGDNGQNWYDTYGGLAQSKGGFLFIDRDAEVAFDIQNNATLTIGNVNASDNNEDTIASVIPYVGNDVDFAKIVKTGDGTLTINSSLNDYYGLLDINAGTLNVNKDWTVRNAVTLASGANVNLTDVTLDKISGTINSYNSSITAQKDYTVKEAVGSITTAEGSVFNAGNVVMKDGTSISAEGEVNISKGLTLEGNDAKAELNGGGSIDGFVRIDGGEVTMTGVKITTGDVYEKEEGLYLQEDIRVNGSENGDQSVSSKLTLDGVEVIGNIMAEHKGSEISITNSTINEGEFYQADKVNGRYQLVLDGNGQPIVEGYTELQAEIGGKVTVENSVLNTSLSAYGEGSEMTVTNSSVKTKGGVLAAEGGKIYLNGNADTVYEVAKDGYFMAASTNQDDTDTKIEINGGTLKAENLRYLVGVGTDENGNTNPCLDESYDGEEQKFYTVKGGIVLQKNSVIETKGDQIFENGVDVSSDENVLASVSGEVTNNAISYVGGTLNLTDEKYSLGYVQSAKENLKTYQTDSKTNIVMTGDLITEEGTNETTVDNAASVGDEVALDKVTVTAGENLIVGSTTASGTIDGVAVKDNVANGFSAGKLNLAEGSTGMVITNAENVTLGGSNGGELVTVNGDAADVKIVIGLDDSTAVDGVTEKTGSFTIGNALAASDTKYNLSGSVTVNKDSSLNVNGQTEITGGVTLDNGAVNVGNGTLVSDITAKGDVTLTGNADIGNLTVNSADGTSTVINVGATDATASTSISNANLNGATICFDPDWAQQAGNHGIAFESNINGKVLVARNNYVAVGTEDDSAAKAMFEKTGLTFGENDITAALYITGNQTLADGTGALAVDGSKAGSADFGTVNAGSFTAAANSVVMVDGQSIKDTAALSGVKDVNIDADAKLYVDGAKKGDTYKVLAGEGIDQGWANENIISNNALLVFTGDNTDNAKFDVTASYDKINNVYGENAIVIDSVVDKTLEVGKEGDAAFDFFNAAANSNNNATKDAQIAAFNSAANMGELAGVNHGTYSMSNAMTDAVAHHLSLATHGEQDKDIWAHYIHNKEDIDGMDFGGIEGSYDAQYNGIVVGSDLYKNGKVTAGVALSYADGNIDGSNVAATTKNDAEYYGASLYGRIDNGNSAILGDISYMHSDNDITQNNSGQEITASADADAFSIGIRAEQAYEAGAGKFVPYAGIRYMHLGAGNYDNSLGMSYDADDQNLWLLPVGVTYSAEVQSGDWTVKPVAEVGYVWTLGDRDTDMTVSLNGAADSFGFETADSGSFIGRLGIEAEKSNVTYGLGYEYQKGDTVKANKWMANLTFSF